MDKMVALGAKGTQKEFDAIVDYLATTYPGEEVPKIKVNEARAIELESGLSLPRSQAAAIVQYRTKNGDFKSIEDLKKVPGVDVAKIEARKDRLLFFLGGGICRWHRFTHCPDESQGWIKMIRSDHI